MPAIQNLVLKDHDNVNHTYVPRDIVGDVATVVEDTLGIPFGNPTFSVQTRRTKGGFYAVTFQATTPIIVSQTIDGVVSAKVARSARAEIKFVFAPSSTEAERKNFVAVVASAFADDKPLVWDSVVKLQGIYR